MKDALFCTVLPVILLDCESRKELDNIQRPAAFVLPGCDRGTPYRPTA
nr:MAG TPA: hypothetical protein [Caudoviricetes sp.]